jgi:protein-disulfide isomerase
MAQKRTTAPARKPANIVADSKGSKGGFYAVIALVAIAGIAGLSYVVGNKKAPPPIVIDPSLPPVTSEGYVMGSPSAPIEVVEFGDFECPGCEKFAELTEPDVRAQLVNAGRIRFRFIDFPLVNIHGHTLNASVAAACADQQGQFWPMHDALYHYQPDWNTEATRDPDKLIKSYAHALPGIDAAKFDQCYDGRQTLGKVQAHLKLAESRNLNGTPTFLIGNKQYSLIGFDEFKAAVDTAIAAADSSKKPAKPATSKKKS